MAIGAALGAEATRDLGKSVQADQRAGTGPEVWLVRGQVRVCRRDPMEPCWLGEGGGGRCRRLGQQDCLLDQKVPKNREPGTIEQ